MLLLCYPAPLYGAVNYVPKIFISLYFCKTFFKRGGSFGQALISHFFKKPFSGLYVKSDENFYY